MILRHVVKKLDFESRALQIVNSIGISREQLLNSELFISRVNLSKGAELQLRIDGFLEYVHSDLISITGQLERTGIGRVLGSKKFFAVFCMNPGYDINFKSDTNLLRETIHECSRQTRLLYAELRNV